MSEQKTGKYAVNTQALQDVIDYLNNSNLPSKEVRTLIDNLTKDAVPVTLTEQTTE